MQRDPRAYLWDAREAAQAILAFTADMDAKAYVTNALVQAAVERKFEVIGEALNLNPPTVWNIVQNALQGLLATVQTLLDELDS